jgi:hypothetical protein
MICSRYPTEELSSGLLSQGELNQLAELVWKCSEKRGKWTIIFTLYSGQTYMPPATGTVATSESFTTDLHIGLSVNESPAGVISRLKYIHTVLSAQSHAVDSSFVMKAVFSVGHCSFAPEDLVTIFSALGDVRFATVVSQLTEFNNEELLKIKAVDSVFKWVFIALPTEDSGAKKNRSYETLPCLRGHHDCVDSTSCRGSTARFKLTPDGGFERISDTALDEEREEPGVYLFVPYGTLNQISVLVIDTVF